MWQFLSILMVSSINALNFIPLQPKKTVVTIHLERFNEKYNLLHIGITLDNKLRKVRLDYRPFNDNNDYDTSNINRLDPRELFPNTNLLDDLEMSDEMEKKDIIWGISNKTLSEILEYEQTLHQKYILGFYDCRHYVNLLTQWALDKPTPVWNLHKIWEDYD